MVHTANPKKEEAQFTPLRKREGTRANEWTVGCGEQLFPNVNPYGSNLAAGYPPEPLWLGYDLVAVYIPGRVSAAAEGGLQIVILKYSMSRKAHAKDREEANDHTVGRAAKKGRIALPAELLLTDGYPQLLRPIATEEQDPK